MDFFWSNVFEYFKDRRVGAVFLRALVLVMVFIGLGIVFFRGWPFAVGAAGLWLLLMLVREVRYWRAWRHNRYRSSPLSRDEIAKARSKLKTRPTDETLG